MSIMGAAVTGMTADTAWLSSISQNVANANTTGYKNAQTSFEALVASQTSAASYDAAGVATSTMSLNSLQGAVVGGQSSVTDLAVNGNGFFVVSNSSGEMFLTRDGSFVPDASGNLVNSAGYYLMGYDIQGGPANIISNSLSGMQMVNVDSAGEQAVPSTTGTFAANLPSTSADGQTETTTLVAYDDLGAAQNINLTWTNTSATSANTWQIDAVTSAGTTSATLTFDPTTGKLSGLTGIGGATVNGNALDITVPGGQTLSLDLGGMTQLASSYAVSASSVNGNAPSSVTGVTVGTDGTLAFQYANGQTLPAYQIPLANVASPDRMSSLSGNVYQTTLASGPAVVGTAGSGGLGVIKSSSLENSTVDLATELTQMIQAQADYQANSKVFQTGATLLDVLNKLQP